jgi:hypothetical protein
MFVARVANAITPFFATVLVQIPSDLVVKMESLDITDVILSMIWRSHLVYAEGRNRKSALSGALIIGSSSVYHVIRGNVRYASLLEEAKIRGFLLRFLPPKASVVGWGVDGGRNPSFLSRRNPAIMVLNADKGVDDRV